MKETGNYYSQKSRSLISETNFPEYMSKACALLKDEDMRSRKFLHSSTYEKVTEKFIKCMVENHLDYFNDKCQDIVNSRNKTDLSNMFTLLSPVDSGVDHLAQEVCIFITKVGIKRLQELKIGPGIPKVFTETM